MKITRALFGSAALLTLAVTPVAHAADTLLSEDFNALAGPTVTPPTGWLSTYSQTGAGGVPSAEFLNGWSARTKANWLTLDTANYTTPLGVVQANQGRSTFKGVGLGLADGILVADGDEADDAAGAQGIMTMDICTPSITVSGHTNLTVAFDSQYRQDNTGNVQSGKVQVMFDGGPRTALTNLTDPPISVDNYDSSVDATPVGADTSSGVRKTLTINKPVAATNMRVCFTYNGGNAWWWAIDNVVVGGDSSVEVPVVAGPLAFVVPGVAALGLAFVGRRRFARARNNRIAGAA